MSNRPFQQNEQQPSRIKIQVQCINCRVQQWIRGPEVSSKATSIRWDCPRCHFNNQTSLSTKA